MDPNHQSISTRRTTWHAKSSPRNYGREPLQLQQIQCSSGSSQEKLQLLCETCLRHVRPVQCSRKHSREKSTKETTARSQGSTPSPLSFHDSHSSWSTGTKPSLLSLQICWENHALKVSCNNVAAWYWWTQGGIPPLLLLPRGTDAPWWASANFAVIPWKIHHFAVQSQYFSIYLSIFRCLKGKIRVTEPFPSLIIFVLPCSNVNMSSPLSPTVPKYVFPWIRTALSLF